MYMYKFLSTTRSLFLYFVLQVSHQVGSLMDWFNTALDLAGVDPPKDRIIDGISLLPLFREGKLTNRSIFYYRGNEMMAVRSGLYKAHYWTWTNSADEYNVRVE